MKLRGAAFLLAATLISNTALSVEVAVRIKSVNDVSNDATVSVQTTKIDVYELSSMRAGSFNQVLRTLEARSSEITKTDLPPGKYIFASKTYATRGNIGDVFSARFLIGAAFVKIGNSPASVEISAATFDMSNCSIVATPYFGTSYKEKEQQAAANGFVLEGLNAGRIIKMTNSKNGACSLDLKFPSEARGQRGMHTYTPTAFETYGDYTLDVGSYMYNGKTDNEHDVLMLGARILDDKQNRIIIRNVIEKTGVNVPWEPHMTVDSGGCLLNVSSRIQFRSDENRKPAQLSFQYVYLDDPFLPYSPKDLLVDKCMM